MFTGERDQEVDDVREHTGRLPQRHPGVVRVSDLNGAVEGVNNKIKTLKRAAYGYRNERYFELKILCFTNLNTH